MAFFINQDLTYGNNHEGGGHPEGRGVAAGLLVVVLVVVAGAVDLPQDGGQDGGDQAARVDGGIEQGEVGFHLLLLVGQLELLGAKGDDAGLDPASPEGDQGQPDKRYRPEIRLILYSCMVYF